MDNLRELVPQLDLIKELYRMEAFRPLAQFLSSLYEETNKQLLSTVSVKDACEDVAVVLDRLNTLGTLKDLPKVVETLKKNLDSREALLRRSRKAQED